MSAALGMSRSTWEESFERVEIYLADYADEDGNISMHPSLARLRVFHDRLACYGLERGWLDLHFADSITNDEPDEALTEKENA